MKPAEQLAALGMSMGLMDLIKKRIKRGRLERIIRRLQVSATTYAHRHLWTREAESIAGAIIMGFGKQSGWEGAEISTPMYANFNLLLLEDSPFQKLIECSQEIVDYFNRAGEDSHSDYDDAVKCYSIWREIVDILA